MNESPIRSVVDQIYNEVVCRSGNLKCRAQAMERLVVQANLIDARFQLKSISEEVKTILQLISKRENILASEARPAKAYIASQDGYSNVYVAAKTSSKARWIVVSGMREAGLRDSAQFHLISVRRAPKYDAWAKTAKRQCYGYDDMPKGV